jgi:hypothetical protein
LLIVRFLETVYYLHDQFASGEVVEVDGKEIPLPLIFYHGTTIACGGEAYIGQFTKKLTCRVGKTQIVTQQGQERERLPWPDWLAYRGLAQRASLSRLPGQRTLEYDGVHLSFAAARQLGESHAAELELYRSFGVEDGKQ